MNELINEIQAAKYLCLSVQTIRNWRCQRKGPNYIKIHGRAIRYRVSDLLEFIEQHRVDLEGSNHA
ncbi:MAG: helix-turn-helix transcriptional regulator [Candidatus Heimdallarchaeota archaeon]